MKGKIKLIIFDCDGTLVDSEVIACEFFPKYWATHGVNISVDDFKEKFVGVGNDSEIGRKVFSQMPAYAKEEGDRLYSIALEKDLRAITGVKNVLSSIDVKMCVASNSSLDHVKKAMNKSELSSFFEGNLFSAEQVKNPKPAAELFLYAAKSLEYKVEECVVVEDSPAGIEAAQNAGMRVIGFSGAAHFTPYLENRLRNAKPNWLCKTVEELHSQLVSLV